MSKQEHSPLPWVEDRRAAGNIRSEDSQYGRLVANTNGYSRDHEAHMENLANCEFIVEACNNYERLKAENQRLRNALEDILGEAVFANKCDIQIVYELAKEALQQEGENQ